MKCIVIAASALFASGAYAQDADGPAAPAASQSTPQVDGPAAATKAAALSIDSPIADLMADERARAVVEAQMPGVESHPAYSQFKAMSLKQVQPFSGGAITDEMIAAISAGLAALD